MGGKMSREKGARGEREVIAMLQPIVDRICLLKGEPKFVLRRNGDQRFAAKEYDIIGLPWIALEVKRVENLSGLGSWWKQTVESCKERQIPVLIYRPNNHKWKVRLRVVILAADVPVYATINVDIGTFLFWFEIMLKVKI